MSNRKHDKALSPERIKELTDAGYHIYTAIDLDPERFGWMHVSSGASQSHYLDVQPFRRTKAQAWADCNAYHSLNMPRKPEPDWADELA